MNCSPVDSQEAKRPLKTKSENTPLRSENGPLLGGNFGSEKKKFSHNPPPPKFPADTLLAPSPPPGRNPPPFLGFAKKPDPCPFLALGLPLPLPRAKKKKLKTSETSTKQFDHSFRNPYILNSKTIKSCNWNCQNSWEFLRGSLFLWCILLEKNKETVIVMCFLCYRRSGEKTDLHFFEFFSEIGFEILFSRALSSLQFCNLAGWFFPLRFHSHHWWSVLHLNSNQKNRGGAGWLLALVSSSIPHVVLARRRLCIITLDKTPFL